MKLAKFNEIGRSMVEMLGVLAIIGVLSVGAIAGYSKAMFKYKMNKTLDVLSHVITRIAELETMNIGKEIYTAQDMIDYGIMPDCEATYEANDQSYCQLPNGKLYIDFEDINYPYLYGWLQMTFTEEPFDSRIAFFTSDIYKNVPAEWWYPLGEILINGGDYHITNFTLTSQEIIAACNSCKTSSCNIRWIIRTDL